MRFRSQVRIAQGLALALVVLALPAKTWAQQPGTKVPVPHQQVLSTSPFLLLFKWFNLDYERKISGSVTAGVSGSYLPLGDFDYGRLTFHARYYPQNAALTGFYMGVQAGAHHVSNQRDGATLTGAGLDFGYAWLLGTERNVSVSLGLGLTRAFGDSLNGASVVLPSVRLIDIGIGF